MTKPVLCHREEQRLEVASPSNEAMEPEDESQEPTADPDQEHPMSVPLEEVGTAVSVWLYIFS